MPRKLDHSVCDHIVVHGRIKGSARLLYARASQQRSKCRPLAVSHNRGSHIQTDECMAHRDRPMAAFADFRTYRHEKSWGGIREAKKRDRTPCCSCCLACSDCRRLNREIRQVPLAATPPTAEIRLMKLKCSWRRPLNFIATAYFRRAANRAVAVTHDVASGVGGAAAF